MNETGVSVLDSVKYIPTLESLELNKTLINGPSLVPITKLSNLKALRVQDDRLSDDAIESIIKLPKLEYLSLSHNPGITDDGVAKLMDLKELRSLRLASLRISDEGLQNIDRLKHLRTLDLSGTNITDKTLDKIKELPLQEIFLSSTNVTDEGVRQLAKCGILDRLALNGCPKVSKGVVSELRESLAHCKVEYNKSSRNR
jgi:Leucine-rich repeat (LRR) protein